jgi:beta-lactamase class A
MTKRNSLFSPARRSLMLAAAALPALPFTHAFTALAAETASTGKANGANDRALAALAALEASVDGRIGLAMLDADGNTLLQYRADERFPLCSTFKMVLAAAILQRSTEDARLLGKRIAVTKAALVHYSPEVEKHVGKQMRVDELCTAAMEHSDNAAANLLLDVIGGPRVVTAYARRLGDDDFMLVRNETDLGTAIPGDYRDTTTPGAMAHTLQRLALGKALDAPQRDQLVGWMRNNKTGQKRIRAGIPTGWEVGDKTGGGDYGTTNDIAVLYRPSQPPLVLAIYFTQKQKDAPLRDDIVAQATRIVTAGFA